jgi:hypothetical protein
MRQLTVAKRSLWVIFDRSTVSARCPLFIRYLPNCRITATDVQGQQRNRKVVDPTVLIPAFFLKLDLAIVLISLTCVASPTAAPRQASVAESLVALPPVSVESRQHYHTPSIPAIECPPLLICPSCGDTMQHVRTIPKLGARLEQFIFVCASCEQVETKEVHKHAA